MSHTIKQFCDKVDSIKNAIDNIQADCLLLAKGKVDKEFFTNINDYESHTKNKK